MADRRGLLATLHRLESQHETAFQLCKVVSCGGMIGTSIMYPISGVEGHAYVSLYDLPAPIRSSATP